MAPGFTIGRLARETGCKVQTIRFYEEVGLLPRPARSEGNQRLYADADVQRLLFIRHCRELGFPLDAIRELLHLAESPDRSCADADRIASIHLAGVERRIDRLRALETELRRMLAECRRGQVAECRIIQVLADHRLCLAHDHDEAGGRSGPEAERPPTAHS